MSILHIYKTNNHLYCQLLSSGNVILSSSTKTDLDTYTSIKNYGNTKQSSELLAHNFGRKLLEKNIVQVSLRTSHLRYHGRIKSFIDTLREQGILIR